MPTLNAPQALHARIRDSLRSQILSGHYDQHDKLPSEKQLMESFGVSRITVRHALGTLEQEGMIFRIAGKGCYVAKNKPTQTLTRLQGFAEAMHNQGYAACNRVLSLNTLPASELVAQVFGVAVGAPMVELRRLRYLERLPVSLDISYFTQELGQRLAREDLVTRDVFHILENDYGQPLGHADLSIEATLATPEEAGLLEVPPASPLLALQRMTWGADGSPLELDFIRYRADRFRYQLRIERH
jgi:GntR family transcriptional regulator